MTAGAIWPPGLLAVIRGDAVSWPDLAMTPAEFLDHCGRHDLSLLVYERIRRSADSAEWPSAVRDALLRHAREETARELLRREEIAGVIDALSDCGVRALVLKGTALAYTVYETPGARPRLDTDLFVEACDRDKARIALEKRGYAAPPYCAELLSQFEMAKIDAFGLVHVMDVHWKISTQPVFAGVLGFEEVLRRAVPVPAIGASALALGSVDALLVACMHPVMHHQNEERLLWMYDIHLLAEKLTAIEFEELVRLARAKQIAEVCGRGLRRAQAMFRTPISGSLLADLDRREQVEPSAEYLASQRRWHHETISSLRALPLGARMRFVRGVLLPSPHYMLGAYGLRDKPLGPWLLPALYIHRNVRGAWRILAGKK
jgi:putative nucleotidyltransferase-like protein